LRVYRLEDKDGRGPYTSRLFDEEERRKYVNPFTSNNVLDDIKGFTLNHVCGCESIRGLILWFGARNVENMIASTGFRLCYYEIVSEDVLHSTSRTQVAFLKRNARGPFFRGLYE